MKSIVRGVILIAIGFPMVDSIFLGNFNLLSIAFDGLGLFWIGKGAFRLWHQRQPQ